jgi:hypothetical protein
MHIDIRTDERINAAPIRLYQNGTGQMQYVNIPRAVQWSTVRARMENPTEDTLPYRAYSVPSGMSLWSDGSVGLHPQTRWTPPDRDVPLYEGRVRVPTSPHPSPQPTPEGTAMPTLPAAPPETVASVEDAAAVFKAFLDRLATAAGENGYAEQYRILMDRAGRSLPGLREVQDEVTPVTGQVVVSARVRFPSIEQTGSEAHLRDQAADEINTWARANGHGNDRDHLKYLHYLIAHIDDIDVNDRDYSQGYLDRYSITGPQRRPLDRRVEFVTD